MEDSELKKIVTNREFIAMIRAKLDAAGHGDIMVDRQWIDEETEGYPFLLKVPVGTDLVLPLQPNSGFFSAAAANADWYVGHFAAALINLRAAEKMLTKYARVMHRAASAEIASARAEGLDLLLEGVGLKPAYAYHLSHKSWKEAALHVLAEVRVRNTSFYLQPETTNLWIEEPSDIAEEMNSLREQQRERQERIAALEAKGADLEVDALTVALLEAHGLQVDAVLREAWRKQHVTLSVRHLGREARLFLGTYDGQVTSSLELEDAYWNGEHLWFLKEELFTGHRDLVGRTLGDRVGHPVLSRWPVVSVKDHPAGRDLVFLDTSDTMFFDADTGRVWRPEERLAA